jgi:hypothetical protein
VCDPPYSLLLFIFNKEKKARAGGGLRCHAKNIMNREAFEAQASTQLCPLKGHSQVYLGHSDVFFFS